jgi:cytochrome P450
MSNQTAQLDWEVPDHVPSELVSPYDFMRGEYVHAFPPEAIESFRDRRVMYSPLFGGFWVLTKYDDIKKVFQDSELFIQNSSGTIPVVKLARHMIPSTLDGIEHHKWRQLLVPLFSPRRTRSNEEMLRAYAKSSAENLASLGRCDIIKDFAQALPVVRFCQQFGFEREQGDELLHLGDELIFGSERIILKDGVEAGQKHRAYITGMVDTLMLKVLEQRRAHPGDDIVTELTQLHNDGAPVDDEDILNVMSLFFFAGSDSSTGAIAYAMLRLATHPEERAHFVAHPEKREAHVEELLRLGAVHYISRRVARDTEFEGITMKAGDMVVLPTLAANRDPAVFPDAACADPDRSGPAHLTFGVGRHRCIGLHQARMEMRIALEEFHAVIPDYQLDPETPFEYITGVRSRPRSLPLVYPVRVP